MNNLNISEFGESATDDFLSKKRSAEGLLEKLYSRMIKLHSGLYRLSSKYK
jgi:hypothetical protein